MTERFGVRGRLGHKLAELGGASMVFTDRGDALLADMRPLWRMALILLALRRCGYGKKMSMAKLYVLNWAVRSEDTRSRFLRAIESGAAPDDLVIRFEPALMRAVSLAVGEGLLDIEKGKNVRLTAAGDAFAAEIEQDGECFKAEKEYLASLKGRVFEKDIQRLLKWEAPE